MSKQIGFYAIDQDYQLLLELAQNLNLVAIPEIIPAGSEIMPAKPKNFHVPQPQHYFYLFPNELALDEAIYKQNPYDQSLFKLNSNISPVIELSPSKKIENEIFNGRLYLKMEKDHYLYSIIAQKYDKFVREIKKWQKTSPHTFYVGSWTAQLVRNKEIKLKHYKIEEKLKD